jgi:hypothetical protein
MVLAGCECVTGCCQRVVSTRPVAGSTTFCSLLCNEWFGETIPAPLTILSDLHTYHYIRLIMVSERFIFTSFNLDGYTFVSLTILTVMVLSLFH